MINRQQLTLGGGVKTGLVDYTLCSDLNSQPKRLMTLTFDLESGVRVTCDVGYL